MQFVCISAISAQHRHAKGEVDIVMWVLQQISYAFQQYKSYENWLRFDKVTESLKVETFLRHSVDRSQI